MSTPGEEPQDRPTSRPGSYGEIAPGVPRYGEYAPAGWEPPQDIKDAQQANTQLSAAPSYPGFNGGRPGTPAASLAPPAKVLLASKLIIAAGIMQAISVIALLVVLLVPAIKASVIDVLQNAFAATPELTALYSDSTTVNTALFLAFILSLAMTGTYFWLARAVRKGAGWARTTSLVLAIVSLLFLFPPNPLTAIQVLLGIVAVFLLYRSPATEFFQAHKAHKSQQR
ncbi:hypothetical protein ART_3110 [Arthrobacter sp. PAMC 25486]|uniref:hypothetical protein n=1 Tax=Arthrobacter sp. PAMC 25486 TaxID=1494608 RepID=UPI0005360E55|nr:hypothetical protein [Arthrobacter sp. PAMC 25486]AIY02709.1 hypothetical protein ART_3110 [Arthrobacter sp. PAMC 25486]